MEALSPFATRAGLHRRHVQEVSLFPQGQRAAVLAERNCMELDEPSVIVADIGGWTVDLMRLDNRIPTPLHRSLGTWHDPLH